MNNIKYIENLRRVLAATNRRATLYDDDPAWSNAYAKNIKRVLPRGKVLNRIVKREFCRAKIIPSPTIQRFRIATASIGDLEIIKNGGWLESE